MHTKSPGETFARLLGLFPPEIRDSMAAATLSLVQFILVQVLVRTNDGGRQAVREYIVMTDELRNTLSGQSHATWGHYIDEIIRQEKRRIRDQVLTMYQNDRIEKSEAALFIPAGEFPDETRRLLAGCNTTAQHLWCPLPFTMIYLLLFPYPSKTTFWVCSGILLFLCSGIFRLDSPHPLYTSVQPASG